MGQGCGTCCETENEKRGEHRIPDYNKAQQQLNQQKFMMMMDKPPSHRQHTNIQQQQTNTSSKPQMDLVTGTQMNGTPRKEDSSNTPRNKESSTTPRSRQPEVNKNKLKRVLYLQSLYRGNRARQHIAYLRKKKASQVNGTTKYFTFEEAAESVTMEAKSSLAGNSSQSRSKRPKYVFKSGAEYTGGWFQFKRDGYGVQRWPDGATYEGDWKKGRAEGMGKFLHVDGEMYHGEWKEDQANGFGVYTHADGGQFVGIMKNDLSNGFGIEQWKDGSHFSGAYSEGQKNGFGVYNWYDGSVFAGNWMADEQEGIGIFEYNDGRSFKGQWIGNMIEGMGINVQKGAHFYEGEYSKDQKHGYGVFRWSDGRQYSGYWANGMQHGPGVYYKPTEQKTKYGLWENGKIIKWFEIPENKTNADVSDFNLYKYFKNAESRDLLPEICKFCEPADFDDRLNYLKIELENLLKIKEETLMKGQQCLQRAQQLNLMEPNN